jgi:hypothetical protein
VSFRRTKRGARTNEGANGYEDQMSKVNDGGPAFPSQLAPGASSGMTMRDYFAAKALPAIYAHAMVIGCESQETIAEEAYEIADGMLKARAG